MYYLQPPKTKTKPKPVKKVKEGKELSKAIIENDDTSDDDETNISISSSSSKKTSKVNDLSASDVCSFAFCVVLCCII